MSDALQPADLGFFSTLAESASLGAAARELGVSTAAVSKRLALLEKRLGVALIQRSTRRMGLTVEGELLKNRARVLMRDLQSLSQDLRGSAAHVSGLLRINATLGFGRSHIAPIVSRFAQTHPQVQVRLQLSVDPPALSEDAFDVAIRFGPPPEARVVAHKLADNRRVLCASPAYLAAHGKPQTPADLSAHGFIGIRQGDEAYGVLKLTSQDGKTESIHMHGASKTKLSTNDGGIAVQWALDGLGLVLRAEWDVREHLVSGALVQVLSQHTAPNADIYAISAPQHHASARVREFVRFAKQGLNATEQSLLI